MLNTHAHKHRQIYAHRDKHFNNLIDTHNYYLHNNYAHLNTQTYTQAHVHTHRYTHAYTHTWNTHTHTNTYTNTLKWNTPTHTHMLKLKYKHAYTHTGWHWRAEREFEEIFWSETEERGASLFCTLSCCGLNKTYAITHTAYHILHTYHTDAY